MMHDEVGFNQRWSLRTLILCVIHPVVWLYGETRSNLGHLSDTTTHPSLGNLPIRVSQVGTRDVFRR